jgi:SAM-dependent methyltransferase
MSWQDRYHARFYDRSRGWRDGSQIFYDLCTTYIPRGGSILEVGAGPSNATSRFLAGIGPLHGLDPDPDVQGNDALVSARILRGERFPFEDGSFDACVSNYVIEHLVDPLAHLGEVRRVLRPGGHYLFRCPNRFHYVALVSWLTPHWLHVRLANRLRNLAPEAHDPYPTRYRMNSRGAVRRLARASGMSVVRLEMIESDPWYGRSSRALFLLFTAYERLVNSTPRLQDLRANIFAVLGKTRS